ncbi:hypothetical protein B0O99DRAFT_685071 [Bisporella sp. PMI_857]|nr:hypothetical protein B0O99DRAFT_685071 [Bisporella sp. PMI_857]
MVTAYAPKYQLDKAQRELKKREASGREERGKEELYKWLQKKTLHSSLPDGQKYTTQLYELLSPRYTCLEGLLCITLATQAEDERCLERLRFSQVGNHNYLKSSEEVELVRLVGGINETQTLLSWIGEEIQERKKVHARRLSGRCYDQGNPEFGHVCAVCEK